MSNAVTKKHVLPNKIKDLIFNLSFFYNIDIIVLKAYNKRVPTSINHKVLIGSFILLVWTLITMFSDVNSVTTSVLPWFYLSKITILIALISLSVATIYLKPIHSNLNNFFLITAALYCIFGEVFCPGYHLAYVQLIVTTVLIYETSKKFSIWFIALFTLSYLLVFEFLNFNNVSVSGYSSYFFDIKLSLLMVPMLTLSLYLLITKLKVEKEFIESKFLNLGNHTARIVHDLKSQLQPPFAYIKMLKQDEELYLKNKEIIDELEKCLFFTKEYVKDINQMTSFNNKEDTIELESVVEHIKQLLGPKAQKTEIKTTQTGSPKIKDVEAFKNILYNLILNSIEAFSEKSIESNHIFISIDDNCFTYQDNAGGLPLLVIKNIKDKKIMSFKKDGTGLGFYFVFKYAELYNSLIEIKNENNGMKLTISLRR